MASDAFREQAASLIAASLDESNTGLQAWSNSLRKKPIEEALAELSTLSTMLLSAVKPLAALVDAVETIRPGMRQIHALRENVPTDTLTDSSLTMLACELDLYEQIIQLADSQHQDILGLALHRSLAALIDRQLLFYQHYLPVPAREWVRIHRLFFTATQRKINTYATSDKACFSGKTLSITHLYCMSLLLGCGRLNRLSPKEIVRVSKALQDWSALVSITRNPAVDSENQLVFDITSGAAPNFKKLFVPEANTISCYLQVDALIKKLDALFAEESKKESSSSYRVPTSAFGIETQPLRSDIIRHLKSAWTEYIYREQRIPTEETVQVCRGLDNVFFYLAGTQTLKEFIGIKLSLSIVYDDSENTAGIQQNRSGDIWSAFTSEPEGSLVTGDIPAEYNFQHFFASNDPQVTHADHPSHTVRMGDTHSHGCCLQWGAANEQAPDVGDIIGICRSDAQGHWHLGEVAWKSHAENGDVSTGIRLLSTRAIPVAIDVPLRLGLTENHTTGILLPPEEALNTRTVTVMLPPLKLEPLEYLTVSQKGIEEKIRLNHQLRTTPDHDSYECAFVVRPPSLTVERKH